MTDRATVNQQVQWAIEATAGTSVAADKTVRSMSIDLDVAGDNILYRPGGHKYNALAIPNQEWTTWQITDGMPTYTEICYPLTAIFGSSTDTTSGSTGQQRVFTITDTGSITQKTLTIEKGSSVRAHKIAYGILTDLTLTWSRKDGGKITGQGIGQRITDGITMTASPDDVALVPIAGKQLDFYIDSTGADIGTTKMLRAFSVEQSITGVYGPIWPINSANASFDGVVEMVPTTSVKIVLEADATGMAYLTQYRSGDLIFARLDATGASFEENTPDITYSLKVDTALGIKTMSGLAADEDGIAVVTLECEIVEDSTWGKAIQVTSVNDILTADL